MIAIWPAVIAAGAAIAGSVSSRREGGRQRRFARTMSSSAYQRAMTDLRLAGLNPILAARDPAASPTPSTPDPGRALTQGGIAAAQLTLAKKAVTAKATMDQASARNIDAQTLIRNEEVEGAKWDVQWKKRLNAMLEGVPNAPSFNKVMESILGKDENSAKALKSGMLPDVWKRPSKPTRKRSSKKLRIFGKGDTIPPNTKGRWHKTKDGIMVFKEER